MIMGRFVMPLPIYRINCGRVDQEECAPQPVVIKNPTTPNLPRSLLPPTAVRDAMVLLDQDLVDGIVTPSL